MSRWGWAAALGLALILGLTRTADLWAVALDSRRGGDFPSFYYAWRAALGGLDPYDTASLGRLARADGLPGGVHPFFYPPPFLLLAPLALIERVAAYRLWFWADTALAAAAAGLLAAGWRDRARAPALAAIAFLATAAVANNHVMGQMNHLVLALVLAGWWADARERQGLAGALIGAAAMLKMSPALFVLWWALRGRWRAVGAAVGIAVALSLAALPLAPFAVQWRFYVEILPGFGSGDYNGLAVPIGIFGNHAPAEVFNAVWPADGRVLSPPARAASAVSSLLLLAVLAAAFRRPPPTPRARGAQLAAVAVATLLVPVYTYEHHLVWALPAWVVVVEAGLAGRLGRGWLAVGLIAGAAIAADLEWVRWIAHRVDAWPAAARLVAEAKGAALLALLAGAVAVGRDGSGRPGVDLRG